VPTQNNINIGRLLYSKWYYQPDTAAGDATL